MCADMTWASCARVALGRRGRRTWPRPCATSIGSRGRLRQTRLAVALATPGRSRAFVERAPGARPACADTNAGGGHDASVTAPSDQLTQGDDDSRRTPPSSTPSPHGARSAFVASARYFGASVAPRVSPALLVRGSPSCRPRVALVSRARAGRAARISRPPTRRWRARSETRLVLRASRAVSVERRPPD